MCDKATTDFVDNLQAIAIATIEKPSYGEWVEEVRQKLSNQAAIAYCKDTRLSRWYDAGYAPQRVAGSLDRRYDALKPILFPPSLKVQE